MTGGSTPGKARRADPQVVDNPVHRRFSLVVPRRRDRRRVGRDRYIRAMSERPFVAGFAAPSIQARPIPTAGSYVAES